MAPERELSMVDGTVEILSESQPQPPWTGAATANAVAAWQAVNVWDSEWMLFVECGEPEPHTLAAIAKSRSPSGEGH